MTAGQHGQAPTDENMPREKREEALSTGTGQSGLSHVPLLPDGVLREWSVSPRPLTEGDNAYDPALQASFEHSTKVHITAPGRVPRLGVLQAGDPGTRTSWVRWAQAAQRTRAVLNPTFLITPRQEDPCGSTQVMRITSVWFPTDPFGLSHFYLSKWNNPLGPSP